MATFNNQIEPVWTFPGRIIADSTGVMSPGTDSLRSLSTASADYSNFLGGNLALVGGVTGINFGAATAVALVRANGTRDIPSAVVNTNVIGGYLAGGFKANTLSSLFSGSTEIRSTATENWSLTAAGSQLEFFTTPNGTVTPTSKMTIANNGIVTAAILTATTGFVGNLTGNVTGNTTGAHNGTVGATTPNTGKFTTVSTSGNTYIGSTGPNTGFDFKFEVVGGSNGTALFIQGSTANDTISVWNIGTSGNNVFSQFYTENVITSRGSITYNRGAGLVAYNTTSDARYKENIVNAPSAISTIKAIQVRSYDWKLSDATVPYGFVAQELYKVYPSAVTPGDTQETPSKTWALDNSILVPVLTKAIQELTQRIEVLETK